MAAKAVKKQTFNVWPWAHPECRQLDEREALKLALILYDAGVVRGRWGHDVAEEIEPQRLNEDGGVQ